ncbi:MAG: NAD(P)H-hydrate epimerase [Planctomycetaceae bacterium]|nr:NAD(P)H-hydrate epimerase [Planctomycetaceae bacterium]
MSLHVFTRRQSRRVDELAQADYGFSGLVLMENAGRGLADVLCQLGIAGPVCICCGKGNNAGDGFVLARHLNLRGYAASVGLWADPDELTGDAAANYRILTKTKVSIEPFAGLPDAARWTDWLAPAAWIVDALLGTGAHGEPRPPLDAVIDRLNAAAAPKLAVDLPSGLDCDTGRPAWHTVRAVETCTFGASKIGFAEPSAAPYLGRVRVLDIGVPPDLLDRVAAEEPAS